MPTPLRLLLGLCLITPGVWAAAPHPSMLTVKYGEQFLPVVKVRGDTPYVMLNGKEQDIRTNPLYVLQDAPGYSDNYVTAPTCALSGEFQLEKGSENTFDPSALYEGHMEFEIPLQAKKTISGGYIIVVLYTADTFVHNPRHPSPTEIIVHDIPDLPAGKLVNVKLSIHAMARALEPKFFMQVFDETGREVLTNGISAAWDYFTLRDRFRLSLAVQKYLQKNQGADHDAVPIFTPKPIFDPEMVLPQGKFVVTLTVNDDGSVISVDAGMIANDSARDSITEALGGWLFLPKLEAGQPVTTYVNVPLQF